MDLNKLSVKDLLTARDETIKSRDELAEFFDLHFCKCLNTNDSNPRGLPTLIRPHESEIAAEMRRECGMLIQCLVEQYDSLIFDLTHEILVRT